jgi:heptose-I-phosphate ethanolaminephosphotransferase
MLRSPLRASQSSIAAILLAAGLTGLVAAGHGRPRTAQVLLLASPAVLWMFWPVSHRTWRALRWFAVSATVAVFSFDGVARSYLQDHYAAAPDSSLVVSAAANTNAREAQEYLAANARSLMLAGGALLAAICLLAGLAWIGGRRQEPLLRRWRLVVIVLLLLSGIGYASKPWRRHHPLLFWAHWLETVQALRASWADRQAERDRLLANAYETSPVVTQQVASTVVLVLTDSVNRDNMSLYGYARPTTPQLAALRSTLGDQWLTLKHAWSTHPSTLASLNDIFRFGADSPPAKTQHLLALVRAAGYKTWWISNHDDVAVDQQHARLADVVDMINQQPGRSTSSLDEELLDCLQEGLEDAAPRKLIVVHLLGAHPHYRLRMPQGYHFFEGQDEVDARMNREGRPAWLLESRREYDDAIHYHDGVVAETLRLTLRLKPPRGYSAWMFISDHGQEVGHSIAHAGHSPGTEAGYRIPALLWRNSPAFDTRQGDRPFRADWAAWSLADLMHLRWDGMQATRNVLSARYEWQQPMLPTAVTRFEQ